jgi:hypothetical protein
MKEYTVSAPSGRLNVRKTAMKAPGNIVRTLLLGEKVKIESVKGAWGKIKDGEWVAMEYLLPIEPKPKTPVKAESADSKSAETKEG